MGNDCSKNYPLADYDAHARSVAPDAYWQQVKRTVNGKPVDEAQIIMIVNAITGALSLKRQDVVLDLACGNGALSSYLFDKCAGLVGVDISPFLTEVARKDFARPPNYRFECDDAVSYVMREPGPFAFTKALIYGAFQCIYPGDAVVVLKVLSERFSSLEKVFIGSVPDKRRHDRFYRDRTPTEAELNDPKTWIGKWYVPEEFEELARATGWRASFSYMPADYFGSAYRFDVTLERPAT